MVVTKDVSEFSEVELYFLIEHVGHMRWRINHDAADGRISNDGVDEELERLYELQHDAISQLLKFRIDPFLADGKSPSQEYWDWWYKWDVYMKNLSPSEHDNLVIKINNREDTSNFNVQ